jgi:ERCC4-related helicase
MDTGSGKTQIAVLRISAELDRCLPEQLVWFLCPTIALATQQHGVLSKQLPAFPCLLLSGNDGVERWKSKGIWDAALENIRVVVSTHQVLLDALIHGCITMPCLALLVFDEGESHCHHREA